MVEKKQQFVEELARGRGYSVYFDPEYAPERYQLKAEHSIVTINFDFIEQDQVSMFLYVRTT